MCDLRITSSALSSECLKPCSHSDQRHITMQVSCVPMHDGSCLHVALCALSHLLLHKHRSFPQASVAQAAALNRRAQMACMATPDISRQIQHIERTHQECVIACRVHLGSQQLCRMTLQPQMVGCLGMAVMGRPGWASSRGPCPWALLPNSAKARATGCRGIIRIPATSLTLYQIQMKNPEWRRHLLLTLHCITSKS